MSDNKTRKFSNIIGVFFVIVFYHHNMGHAASLDDCGLDSSLNADQKIEEFERVGSASSVLHYYLSPDGKDSNSGMSDLLPLKTLEKLNDLLNGSAPGADKKKDIVVHIKEGNYYRQSVNWTFTMSRHKILFQGEEGAKGEKATFFGCDKKDDSTTCENDWFKLAPKGSANTNLHFRNLIITNYLQGLRLGHSLEEGKLAHKSGCNSVSNLIFRNIGSLHVTKHQKNADGTVGKLMTGRHAINLVNSNNNLFYKNTFKNIENDRGQIENSDYAAIHGFYISHFSNNNQVIGNHFIDISESPVKVRDYSNWNIISHNQFTRTGAQKAAYEEWYCDSLLRKDCTGEIKKNECPSWGNRFTFNKLISSQTISTEPKDLGKYYCLPEFGIFKKGEEELSKNCHHSRPLAPSGNLAPRAYISENNLERENCINFDYKMNER